MKKRKDFRKRETKGRGREKRQMAAIKKNTRLKKMPTHARSLCKVDK